MKATHVQVFSLMGVGVAVFATILVFGVYQNQKQDHDAEALVEPRATAAQLNQLCMELDYALREIAKYHELTPPVLMQCERVENATSEP